MTVIIINHIGRWPNGLEILTGRGILWVSAAEGFVAISGILVGYIYGPRILRSSRKVVAGLLKRALKLYIAVLGLSIFFMCYSYFIAPVEREGLEFVQLYSGDISGLIVNSLTLQYVYGWGEFLSHYVFFLLASPLILWLIARFGWLGSVVSLATSFAIYYINFVPFISPDRMSFTLSWQFLFIIGVITGYYLPLISMKLRNIFKSKRSQFTAKFILYSLAIAIVYISMFYVWAGVLIAEKIPTLAGVVHPLLEFGKPLFSASVFLELTDKTSLGLLRILFGSIVFWALFMVLNDYGHKLWRPVRNLFETFGTSSLLVYGCQAVVVYFTGIYIVNSGGTRDFLVINTGVTLLAIYLIYRFIIFVNSRKARDR